MTPLLTQADKAALFRGLHYSGKLLVLPNIWDPLSALLLEQIGFKAVATANAAVAYANGYPDGERFPLKQALILSEQLVCAVNIPVSVDIECGYSLEEDTFKSTIRALLQTGIVGINLEDSNPRTGTLLPIPQQVSRIQYIKEISTEMDIPLFINARTDVYKQGQTQAVSEQLAETLRRGQAYREAGADCIYPILLKDERTIQTLVKTLHMPVNILLTVGVPDINTLQQIGVARVSTGPAFLGVALKALAEVGALLNQEKGFERLISDAESLKNLPPALM